jgi:LacI family transcriptional regulator
LGHDGVTSRCWHADLVSRLRLAEIARHANTSEAQVSRVINNKAGVAPAVRQRIHAAMRALGSSGGVYGIVGLIIPDTTNPFFASLGSLFQEMLEAMDLQVVTGSSEGQAERELSLVNKFQGFGLRGLVYITRGRPSREVLQALAVGNVPVVAFDRRVREGNLDFISVNSRDGMRRAADYLASFGHRDIGHLTGLLETETAMDRLAAFREALALNRLVLRDEWIWYGDYGFASGRACAEDLLFGSGDVPTAVIAGNDAMAIGLLQRLQEAGWAVPRDISLVGFDNIEAGRWVHPRLTTVDQRIRLLAYEAVALLVSRMRAMEINPAEPPSATHKDMLPALIPRDSVGKPRTRALTK